MKQSESIKELATALSKFQGAITSVVKDATVQTAKFSYKYAGLPTVIEHIQAEMSRNDLSIVQAAEPELDVGHLVIETMLLHGSGEWISGYTSLKPVNDDPQGMGSAITYARRYGLCAILGIAADEDDDGETAQVRNTPQKSSTEDKKKQQPEQQGPPEDTGYYCPVHNVKYKATDKRTKGDEWWYSHKADGKWCNKFEQETKEGEPGNDNVPDTKPDVAVIGHINLVWLKESLSKIRASENASVAAGWTEANVLSYMGKAFKVEGDSILEVAPKLSKEQAAQFEEKVNSALDRS